MMLLFFLDFNFGVNGSDKVELFKVEVRFGIIDKVVFVFMFGDGNDLGSFV